MALAAACRIRDRLPDHPELKGGDPAVAKNKKRIRIADAEFADERNPETVKTPKPPKQDRDR